MAVKVVILREVLAPKGMTKRRARSRQISADLILGRQARASPKTTAQISFNTCAALRRE